MHARAWARAEVRVQVGLEITVGNHMLLPIITESVDSVCRDGTDMAYVQHKQKPGKLCHKHSHKLSKVAIGIGLRVRVLRQRMAALPSLDEALRGVAAEKLDQQCSRDDLNEISKYLTRWPEVSPFLGLTEADEEDVRAKGDRAVSGLTRERVNVLRRWQENQKERATYRWVWGVGRGGSRGVNLRLMAGVKCIWKVKMSVIK